MAIIVNATFKFPIVENVSFNEIGFKDVKFYQNMLILFKLNL